MSKASFFRYLKLTRCSQPAHLRELYRAIVQRGARRIVEIGVGDGSRAQAMMSLSLRAEADKPAKYTGIDLFEARDSENPLSLKQAHTLLRNDNFEVRLVPGDTAAALKRSANELRGTDMIVVSADVDPQSLDAVRHLLPRMLHKDSQVWIELEKSFKVLGPADLRGPLQRAA